MKRLKKTFLGLIMLCLFMLTGCGNGTAAYYKLRVKEYNNDNKRAVKGAVVFVGDSLTEMCRLKDYYPVNTYTMYNRGISGDTTQGVIDRLQENVLSIEPAQIVLLIGINDLIRGKDAQYVWINLLAIIERINDALPACGLVIQSLYPVNDKIENYSQHTEKILYVNARLEANQDEFGYFYANVFDKLKNEKNKLGDNFSSDGLHLNSRGYKIVAETVTAELMKVLT